MGLEKNTQKILKRLKNEPAFAFLKQLQNSLPAAEIYLVGGAVRDSFLNRASKDYDFIVRGVPAEKLKEELEKLGQVDLVGRVFGVFKFVPKSHQAEFLKKELEPFDLALPRTEHAYLSGGYRDFKVQSDPELPIEKDLSRRDFTINAIALDISQKTIVDPYNGLADLENKIIRAVGEPKTRFKEDYSRILRGLRQACQLGFELEKETFATIKKMIGSLNEKITPSSSPLHKGEDGRGLEWIVPRETIAKEIIKAFLANPVRAFDLFEESGVFTELLPEVEQMKGCPQPPEFHSEGDVFVHTRLALEKLTSADYQKTFGKEKLNALLVFSLLFHDLGKVPSLRTPEEHGTNRIRFDGHNETGAAMAQKIVQRLTLSSLPEDTSGHINEDALTWLISNHLLLLTGDPEKMRAATIEKYFFNPLKPGTELIRLSYCDVMAAIPANLGQSDMTNFEKMMERIEKVGKLAAEKQKLPAPILDGNEIMKLLKIKPGKEVGRLIEELRNAQLSGKIKNKKEAEKYLKTL